MEIYRRVATLPGVEQSAIAGNDTLPMNSGRNYSPFTISGRAADSERRPVADIAIVDTQYFHTMEVPLMAGRNFTALDTNTTQAVAVIDQTLAHRYWPDQDPLGQQVKFGFGRGPKGVTIVGVVGDIKSDGFEAPSVPHIYVALGQFAPINAVVFLRGRSDAEHLGEAVRHVVEASMRTWRCTASARWIKSLRVRWRTGGSRWNCWAFSRRWRCCWPRLGFTG